MFDNYAKVFDASLVKQLEYNAPRLLVNLLKPYLKEKKIESVLDIGCGTGSCWHRTKATITKPKWDRSIQKNARTCKKKAGL